MGKQKRFLQSTISELKCKQIDELGDTDRRSFWKASDNTTQGNHLTDGRVKVTLSGPEQYIVSDVVFCRIRLR